MGGVTDTRKATSNEVASFIFGAGQKRAPSVVSENAPLFWDVRTRPLNLSWLILEHARKAPAVSSKRTMLRRDHPRYTQ